MKQHGRELNDQNQREEEHKDQTDWLELQVFFRDMHLNCCGGGDKIVLENWHFSAHFKS
jgi:hypothetical protein